jgi:hypothetical protein
MKIKIFLILIFVVCGLIIIYQKQQPKKMISQRVVEEQQVTPVEPLDITVPKSLKINFQNVERKLINIKIDLDKTLQMLYKLKNKNGQQG